jgi:glycosyltransferase involved in cell wall biosynthesis
VSSMKIALFSPLHPMKSGIADYTEEMLPLLRKHFEIDLYVDPQFVPTSASLRSEFGVFPFRPEAFSASGYDAIVYHMGNYYPAHRFIYDALRKNPGIVVLHDYVLQGFYARRAEVERNFGEYRALLETYYGKAGTEIADGVSRRVQPPIWETEEALDFPLNEEVFDLATGVIVHSAFIKKRVQKKTPKPVVKIPHHGHVLKTFDREAERKKWGAGPDDILVSSMGFVNRNRRYELVIAALGELADPRLSYFIAGEDRGKLLRDLIAGSKVRVSVQSFLPLEELESLIVASDICVNLRYPTMGESSGALLRQMGYARPTLITNCGSYAEIPDWAAVKIEPDMDESALLKAHLAALIKDPDFRESLGREASSYVRSECEIEKCVRSYADFITGIARGLKQHGRDQ